MDLTALSYLKTNREKVKPFPEWTESVRNDNEQ